ncbi:MAG: hypothetical protein E6J87_00515 [Deltaproteobacteria bacterium]|nr:MAG: hypothetical protein E6J87_00515 [Deltaproteobacteria bacterium]
MSRLTAYRALCGAVGALFVVSGLICFAGFFRAQAPGGEMAGPIPLGVGGLYFLAFTGCALVGWGGALLGAARQPHTHRTVGTAAAFALVMMAVYRIAAWLIGDYAFLGNLPRVEAAVLLLFALAFVWLRPPAVSEA